MRDQGFPDADVAASVETSENVPVEEINLNKRECIEFILHNELKKVPTEGLSPQMMLVDYIRDVLKMTGTKHMCREGGCGACVVSATFKNPMDNTKQTLAVNSCLVPILQCHDWHITTIEGVGNRQDGYDILQQKMVAKNGTQCGFCSPGMVMNAYALRESGKNTQAEIETSLGGHICRCTGYRPILEAFKSVASDSDDSLLGLIPDIEDIRLCKKEGCEKTCSTPCAPQMPFYYELESKSVRSDQAKSWFKVNEVRDIFAIIRHRDNRNRSYRLVSGNTAKALFKDMDKREYYIDVSGVKSLKATSRSTKSLWIGANCTLTETITIFKKTAAEDDGYKHLLKVVEHMELIANLSVRNIGTLAGNLMMKRAHNEFPSDVFLLLETLKAKVYVNTGIPGVSMPYPPRVLIRNDFRLPFVITSLEIPPLDNTFFLETYKIMPRAQNTLAYVNAGFLFRIRNNTVEESSIVYGGIHPDFVHATQTENYIKNKQLFNNTNLAVFLQTLTNSLQPNHALTAPSPEYRKQLAVALAYKYVLSLAPVNTLPANIRSGGQKLVRPALSSGVQEYTIDPSLAPVGQPINKLEAYDQVSGSAKYTFDLPDMPHQLHAVFVCANYPAGSVVTGLNASQALKLAEVVAFYKAEDIPGVNSFMAPSHQIFFTTNEHLFIPTGEPLRFYGQPVGMIVATTKEIATEAAGLVEVICQAAQTSPLLNIADILSHTDAATKARVRNLKTILPSHQDENAEVKFKGIFNMCGQAHFSMEMQVVQVIPTDDGGLHIQPSTQYSDGVHFAVTQMLKLAAHKIIITVKRVGGAFGSKLTRSNWTACAASLAAYKLNRPVKMSLTLEENLNLIGKRNPSFCSYEVGTDPNGKIKFLNEKVYSDVGAYQNCNPVMQTLDAMTNTYLPATFDIEYNIVITDTPASTWARSPGALEGVAIHENLMEHISYKTQKDALDVRLQNINADKHPQLMKMITEFVNWTGYRSRRQACNTFNSANRWRKKGLAIMPSTVGLHFLVNHCSQISIYRIDGTVAVSHGGVEIGQGINTKMAQVVAYEFGIPLEQVSIRRTDNFVSPNNFATGGSLTTESIYFSLKDACAKLKGRIEWARNFKGLPKETPWLSLVQNAFSLGQNLSENSMWVANPTAPPDYNIYGLACAEVEVDLLTGTHIMNRVDLMEDAGDSSNPYIDIGQVEGAFTMGAGYWTLEKTIYDHDGRNLTNNTWAYKVPGARDIPVDFRVKLPSGVPNPNTPYQTKATSEAPACLGFVVSMAIRDALRSARTQDNPSADPWVPLDGPMTVESIFMNGLSNSTQFRI